MGMVAEWFAGQISPAQHAENAKLCGLFCLAETTLDAVKAMTHGEALEWGLRCQLNISMTLQQDHWSRVWEYPWVILNGDFRPGHKVLDVGGCASIVNYRIAQLTGQVTMLDLDAQRWQQQTQTALHKKHGKGLSFVHGDGKALPFFDATFDRVTCISVLEHDAKPEQMLAELLRVLKPGGRLLLTLDVTSQKRPLHNIGLGQAQRLAEALGLQLPAVSQAAVAQLPALAASEGGPCPESDLRVLGLALDKPVEQHCASDRAELLVAGRS